MPTFLSGFALSISLILAIGAQNAFVLKFGMRREHVLPIVLTCS
ncbi:MAG: amino acid transporter, partial [Halocynthiibacter sp.]